MMKKYVFCTLFAAALWGVGAGVFADPIVTSVDRNFGSGSESIYIVIDWNDGPADSLTWQLNYENSAYANLHDALLDLQDLDTALSFTLQDFGFGAFIDGISFNEAPISHSVDTSTSPAPRDWISAWEGPASGNTWSFATSGISGTSVTNGMAYGFAVEADWNNPASPPNAVPEPGALILLIAGFGVVSWLRRIR